MNGNIVSDQYNYNLSSGHINGQKGVVCVDRHHFFSPASYYASIITHLLSQPEANHELEPRFFLPSSQKTELLLHSSENSPSSLSQVPGCGFGNTTQFHNDHLQAKRSRVENILQGMSITPNPALFSTVRKEDQYRMDKVKESCAENKRKQKRPQQQSLPGASLVKTARSSIHSEDYLKLKRQLHTLQSQLKQLRERYFQPYQLSVSGPSQEDMAQMMDLLKEMYGQSSDKSNLDVKRDQHKDNLRRSISNMRGPKVPEEKVGVVNSQIPDSGEGNFLEILKHELINGVVQAVDSVLKKVLSGSTGLQSQQPNDLPATVSSAGRRFPCGPVTEKNLAFPTYPVLSKSEEKPCQISTGKHPWNKTSSEVPGNEPLGQMLLCSPNDHWGNLPRRMGSSPESLGMPWQPTKLKSSVIRQQQCPVSYKSETENMVFIAPSDAKLAEMHAMVGGMYFPSIQIQEALMPGHLKKAKLMFFFSRYPTSSLLKAYFLDIQFTRSITSQLIKWFSNFREFYYIQMEKFARQAVSEGAMNSSGLLVTRDSELFRILNLHYNKGNDFEVPDGFLDVSSLTLQEFFNAVRAGKDSDPSWKKPIYKIISKLDSEIPDTFKSSNCPQGVDPK